MSQPNNSVTEEDVQLVKEIIYRLENIWIQRKHFLDQGRPNFITNTDIQDKLALYSKPWAIAIRRTPAKQSPVEVVKVHE